MFRFGYEGGLFEGSDLVLCLSTGVVVMLLITINMLIITMLIPLFMSRWHSCLGGILFLPK